MPPSPISKQTTSHCYRNTSEGLASRRDLDTSPGTRWPAQTALLLLRLYKILISPLFTGSCRFIPSCADYAAEAIGHYGVLKGSNLAIRRLARCHPLCDAGYDPVPGTAPKGRTIGLEVTP